MRKSVLQVKTFKLLYLLYIKIHIYMKKKNKKIRKEEEVEFYKENVF